MHWPIQAVLCLPAKQAGREFIVPASQSALLCFSGRLVEVDQQKWCFFISLFNWKGAENRLRAQWIIVLGWWFIQGWRNGQEISSKAPAVSRNEGFDPL